MNGVAPGYAYYYDYLTQNIRPVFPGSPHTFEITYVFGSLALMPQAPKQVESGDQCARIEKDIAGFRKTHVWPKDWYPIVDKNSPQDQAITKRMSESWAAFAKTGNPNVSGQLSWPIYNLNADIMRNYSDGPETITGLLKDRVAYQMLHLREIYALERLKNAF
jgi:para-nitrobenzyl esterase